MSDWQADVPAAAQGYRLPAEWEPLAAVWVVPPHNRETWPGCFEQAAAQFAVFLAELAEAAPVCTPASLGIPTNDSWIRDFGPLFVVRDEPGPATQRIACHDFRFNGWGDKYETRDLDDAVTAHIAQRFGMPCWRHELILEGGSIDVNGTGSLLTTEQCLLNPNRATAGPARQRDELEAALGDALGVRNVIWLPGGIAGDDTDGHIDDVARFVRPDTVFAVAPEPGHPDHDAMQQNLAALSAARDERGQRLTVVGLPAPEPIIYDFPADRFGPGGREPVPASYGNFLMANQHLFVPVFGQSSDDAALALFEQALPGWTLHPIRAEWLVVGLGGLHCLSMQQPA